MATNKLEPMKPLVQKKTFLPGIYLQPVTRTEWILFRISMLLMLAILAMSAAFVIYGLPRFGRRNICLSERCVRAAGRILDSLDETIDPCEDFYTFSCGKWIRKYPVPDTQGSWSQFNVLHERLTRTLREILERKNNTDELRPVVVAREMYRTCMEREQDDSVSDLREIIQETLADIENDMRQLGKTSAKVSRIKADLWEGGFIFDAYVYLGLENPDNHTLFIGPPSLWVPQPFFLDNVTKHIDAYAELIGQIWSIVYPEENSTVVAEGIIKLSNSLAQSMLRQEERRNKTKVYKLMTIAQLTQITKDAPMIAWEDFMRELFKTVPEMSEVTNWSNYQVTVGDINYFRQLGGILREAGPEVIRNYMAWGLMYEYAPEASPTSRRIFFEYAQKTKGTKHPHPRWKHCTQWMVAKLGRAVAYYYALEDFNNESKVQVEEIFKDTREAFAEILEGIDWIEPKTKKIALEKYHQMRNYIAYPDYLEGNTAVLLDYYEELKEANKSSHFRNDVATSKFIMEKNFGDIIKERDFYIWREHAAIVNAFYYPTFNAVYLPAGILQIPLFGYPIQALNYGGIGTVIGHEITHGFDDEGRQKDGYGKLVNWWDNTTLSRFLHRAQCFIKQYNESLVTDVNATVNGINTQGENIADNGAIYQAHRAYLKYKDRHGEEQWLPGLNYSPDQLFFIGYGQKWCESITKEALYNQLKTGAHSPSKFRTNAVLQNFPEFSNVWGCPSPKSICRIW